MPRQPPAPEPPGSAPGASVPERLRAWLVRFGPLRRFALSRRMRVLREVVIPLHGFLEQVHEQTLRAYEALAAQLNAHPGFASARVIDSVQDERRHLKTYQLVLGEGRPEVTQAWFEQATRLETLGRALTWSSRAFKQARDQLDAATAVPDSPEARRSDAYFQALTMYHTLRSRGSLTFRIHPERTGDARSGFAPDADIAAVVARPRRVPAELVTFLVYERTDGSVARELGEIIEGTLWTKRNNWRAVESAYREQIAVAERRSPGAVAPQGATGRRSGDRRRA